MKSHQTSLSRFIRFLDGSLVRHIVIAVYAYFFLIILSEVVQRYFFAHSTTWGEMTARYAFVYFAYLAMAEAFRHDEHIRIDLIPNRLGPLGRKVMETYIDLLCVFIAAIVIWYSIQLMQVQQMANIRMHALPLNMSWAQAALPLGWGLMIIRIAQRLVRRFKHQFNSDLTVQATDQGTA
jgi:TRAP-type C4-dicarboxylate transport system permease small subunit